MVKIYKQKNGPMYFKIIVFTVLVFAINSTYSQYLKKVNLSNEEKKEGAVEKYEYSSVGSYGYVGLLLYKNGTYIYKSFSFAQNLYSDGKWHRVKSVIFLNSKIEKDNIPVKLIYCNSDTLKDKETKIKMVANLRGETFPDAFVNINNDSINCVPSMDTCFGSFNTIDRIKIVFENGYSSKWIKVVEKEYKRLQPIVQVDFNLSSYVTFKKKKYTFDKTTLKLIEE
jgi:hypothetical protein